MSDDHQPTVPVQGGHRSGMELQQAFTELARIPLDEVPLSQVLRQVAELAKTTLPEAPEVSVTLIEDDRAHSVAFTGDIAVHLDERQYQRGFGPCMDAALSGSTISIPDVSQDDRYPDYSAAAERAGIRSSLSVGMPVPQRTVGGLNLYSRSVNGFDEAAVASVQAFADFAAVAVVNAALVDSKTALARQLEEAMASRAVIEQAKGILMGRLRCGPDEAFVHLTRQSQRTNRKLHAVAADLVAEAGRPQGPVTALRG